MRMREDLDDLLASPSCDVVKCFLFPPYFFRRHDVLWWDAVSSGDIVGAINIAILSVWIAIKEMLSLGLVFALVLELTTSLTRSYIAGVLAYAETG